LAPLSVGRKLDRRLGGVELTIPELAGDLLEALIEALTVVRELAAPHEVAVTEPSEVAGAAALAVNSGRAPRPPARRSVGRRVVGR